MYQPPYSIYTRVKDLNPNFLYKIVELFVKHTYHGDICMARLEDASSQLYLCPLPVNYFNPSHNRNLITNMNVNIQQGNNPYLAYRYTDEETHRTVLEMFAHSGHLAFKFSASQPLDGQYFLDDDGMQILQNGLHADQPNDDVNLQHENHINQDIQFQANDENEDVDLLSDICDSDLSTLYESDDSDSEDVDNHTDQVVSCDSSNASGMIDVEMSIDTECSQDTHSTESNVNLNNIYHSDSDESMDMVDNDASKTLDCPIDSNNNDVTDMLHNFHLK